MGGKKKNAAYPPLLPRRPERPSERHWPPPTPVPMVPAGEDVGKLLKQILNRLDKIEKRLEKIETMLAGRLPPP
ncbi:MAG: hypothetical protein U9O89_00120 [Thermoproteota archaeon]|nr:hypothetical protein [Thermoproteota archaeon]